MPAQDVVFRVDSSLQIGIGHLMRCLALAAALRERGHICSFVCREHPGHRIDLIRARGFAVLGLPSGIEAAIGADDSAGPYGSWLGGSWREDSKQTIAAIGGRRPNWLVVDHYALDARWERELRVHAQRIMVIDDLADRYHDADLLLDQNLGRMQQDYADLVPTTCQSLIGPRFALLRPEFAAWRVYSLARRRTPRLEHVMVSMGGVDANNATGQILEALQESELPTDCRITIVMGGNAPWLAAVREQAAISRRPCEVRVEVTQMAQLMADSDLVIGAAGTSAWERCCLGVPSVVVVVAPNQRPGAIALEEAGAVVLLEEPAEILPNLALAVKRLSGAEELKAVSAAAAEITQGNGVYLVAEAMSDG